MPLPDLIEMVPLSKLVQAEVSVPGSKSITNRALILSALCEGETTLEGALWSEDTQVMVECLRALGFAVRVTTDPQDSCNRTITVSGSGGRIGAGGPVGNPLPLFVGNAGTAARFLSALVCLGEGAYRLQGAPRMQERPQAALFQALRQLGYRVESANDKLPAIIQGSGPRPGSCRVSIEESSQFASALLLSAKAGGWKVEVVGENAEESPYVAMTLQLVKKFEGAPDRFSIEPDASSGSYFWAAGWLNRPLDEQSEKTRLKDSFAQTPQVGKKGIPRIEVAHWPKSGWQIDSQFPGYLPLPKVLSREGQLGDGIMTAIVIAPFADHPTRFTDLSRLRNQECDRVGALRRELAKCGVAAIEKADTLHIFPSAEIHGAEIETYNDHRMAMCFATLGLKVPHMKIKNPACVKKTFPNFFQKLATLPPAGLGATILDGLTGRALALEEMFAA